MGATATGFNFTTLDGVQYLNTVAACKVTTFCAPPTAWRMFINLDMDRFDLSALRQSISAGNLSENDRAQIFLMDYANRQRIKIWGRARVVERYTWDVVAEQLEERLAR